MPPSSEQIRVQAIASGRVQGVSYRWFVLEQAREHGVNGWVKNLADGRVEAELEGPREAVERVIEAMKQGPMMAHVSGVAIVPLTAENRYKDFQVRH